MWPPYKVCPLFYFTGKVFYLESCFRILGRGLFCLHIGPKYIISNINLLFLHSFLKELLHMQGINLKYITNYYLEIDWQTKVVNRILVAYLICFTNNNRHNNTSTYTWIQFGTTLFTQPS